MYEQYWVKTRARPALRYLRSSADEFLGLGGGPARSNLDLTVPSSSEPHWAELMVTITTMESMNSKQVIKRLEAEGWYLARVKGSHHQFKHATQPGLVTVKHPDGDIPKGTLHSIKKQAGWQ